jgi:osmotically-inducible protein OsmY
MRKLVFTVAALAACAPAGACVVMAPVAAAGIGMAAVQDRTPGQIMDDASDYADVKTRLLAADAQGFSQTHVQVYADNLLLTGSVPDEAHRQTAEMVARNIRSLHNVYDELNIGERTSFSRGVHDGWIESNVRAHLLASRRVRVFDINIEVFHGNVYLMGTARSDAELHAAAEIASRVGGVRRVVSFMEVIEHDRPNTYAAAPAPGQYAPENARLNVAARAGEANADAGAPIAQPGASY